jgi:tRNA uridine 5-carbamoylmethylation protein Kti12
VIIVSGIPGSGKSKLSESLTKLISAEGVDAFNFKP